jgi:hypothetical protein
LNEVYSSFHPVFHEAAAELVREGSHREARWGQKVSTLYRYLGTSLLSSLVKSFLEMNSAPRLSRCGV